MYKLHCNNCFLRVARPKASGKGRMLFQCASVVCKFDSLIILASKYYEIMNYIKVSLTDKYQ